MRTQAKPMQVARRQYVEQSEGRHGHDIGREMPANVTRGVPLKRRSSPKLEGVDSAEIAQLPRLPDTSEELKSIALALQADPSKVSASRQGRHRGRGEDHEPLRLQGAGLRHPWPDAG